MVKWKFYGFSISICSVYVCEFSSGLLGLDLDGACVSVSVLRWPFRYCEPRLPRQF